MHYTALIKFFQTKMSKFHNFSWYKKQFPVFSPNFSRLLKLFSLQIILMQVNEGEGNIGFPPSICHRIDTVDHSHSLPLGYGTHYHLQRKQKLHCGSVG